MVLAGEKKKEYAKPSKSLYRSLSFDRVSHGGLLYKVRFIFVCGSVLFIFRVVLSNRMQRVVVDGATAEWILVVSASMLGHRLFILHIGEIFDLVENILFPYADDSTLLAVVSKEIY